jgi:hypothetical protein
MAGFVLCKNACKVLKTSKVQHELNMRAPTSSDEERKLRDGAWV